MGDSQCRPSLRPDEGWETVRESDGRQHGRQSASPNPAPENRFVCDSRIRLSHSQSTPYCGPLNAGNGTVDGGGGRIWHIQDSHGHIPALTFQSRSTKHFKVSPRRSAAPQPPSLPPDGPTHCPYPASYFRLRIRNQGDARPGTGTIYPPTVLATIAPYATPVPGFVSGFAPGAAGGG